MKNKIFTMMSMLIIGLIISNCSLLDSNFYKKVSLNLATTSIFDGDTLRAIVFNNNTHPVHVYKNSVQTHLQKRTEDGQWYRYRKFRSDGGEVREWSDYYVTINSKNTHNYSISYNEIQKYHDESSTYDESFPLDDNVQGKYRLIFEIADQDRQNRKVYVSDVFEVK